MSLDGPQLGAKECISELSKNLKGRFSDFSPPRRETEKCSRLDCVTYKVVNRLEVEVRRNRPCDSKISTKLDGTLEAKLMHGFNVNGEGRGVHYGKFRWKTIGGATVAGQMWGINNGGTHRKPLGRCEECNEKGHIEGRLAGEVYEGDKDLIGCRVFASYVLRLADPSSGFLPVPVSGTLEGAIVCECDER